MSFLDEFQQIVYQYPERVALVDYNGERRTTYRELDVLSRKIAAKLKQTQEVSERAVLVCMGRRMEYIAAEIGIMAAGAAFVPVLPEYPQERIDFIREDCQAAAVIDEEWLLSLIHI